MGRLIRFDSQRGIIRAEAGLSLANLLDVIVPKGWFLPVSPGTKFVTLGGAVANDIHGKNHHRSGTFGCHVRRFELLRSDGTRRECSADENAELFRATIGGLGLTGLISWVELQLKAITSPCLDLEQIRFHTFDEYVELERESSDDYEYTVSWIDCLRADSVRGLFQRANFSERNVRHRKPPALSVPIDVPSFLLNSMTMKMFNMGIYHSQRRDHISKLTHFEPFFYPLDMIRDWNRAYGKPGFFQYQFVVPNAEVEVFRDILQRIVASGQGSFLVVLKKFGSIQSPGMMSFPKEGFTLALDFPNRGQMALDLFDELDQMVMAASGSVYPAKDARMSADHFQSYFPQWKEFARYMDPNFSSSFWRRVTAGTTP
jgi:FAD/FMN-containing dehydrogenase